MRYFYTYIREGRQLPGGIYLVSWRKAQNRFTHEMDIGIKNFLNRRYRIALKHFNKALTVLNSEYPEYPAYYNEPRLGSRLEVYEMLHRTKNRLNMNQKKEVEQILKLQKEITCLYTCRKRKDPTEFTKTYYKKIVSKFGDCSRESENKYRTLVGIPKIGQGWVSQQEVVNLCRIIFRGHKIKPQARPSWLEGLTLDVYIEDLRLAIEYQGRQHYEPVKFFGGKKAFKELRQRDALKRARCKKAGVLLVRIPYFEKNVESLLLRIKDKLEK